MVTKKWKLAAVAIVSAGALAGAAGMTMSRVTASAPYDVLYTTNADFGGGALFNLNHDAPNADQLQLNTTISTFPALWVANAGEDTVSKIDTNANKESARYRTWFPVGTHGPWNGPAPSRTAVAANGDAFILNRHFGDIPGPRSATLVKIKGSGFVDRNNNGVMDTATDLNNDGMVNGAEVLAMGPDVNANGYPDSDSNGDLIADAGEIKDERVEWSVRVGSPNGLGRSLCMDPAGNAWVGLYNQAAYYKVDGDTGAILAGPISTGGGNPYGCVIDSAGMLYGASLSSYITVINTNTNALVGNPNHSYTNYGITTGAGKAYISLINGPRMWATYNGSSFSFSGPPGDGITAAVDPTGNVYSGRHTGDTYKVSPTGTILWAHNVGSQLDSRGTVIDANGDIWRIHLSTNSVVKHDKNTGAVLHTQPVGLSPYTYSDATGINAISSTPAGSWTVVQDSTTAGTLWDSLVWNQEAQGNVPAGATIVAEVRAADTVAALGSQPMTTVSTSGPLPSGITGRYLEVVFRLTANSAQETPVLSDVRVVGHAPNSAPEVTCNALTLFTSPNACTAPSASVGSATDPDGDTLILAQAPEGPYGLGSTPVTLTATDPSGATASCPAAVTVVDNQPPSIACPAPTTLECTGPNTAFTPAAANAADNCSIATVNNPAAGMFPLGMTTLAYSATDGSGASAGCTSAVTIVDTTAPVISSVTNSFSTIWPPSHNMVPLNLTVTATDSCAGGAINTAAACRVTNITSNEAINSTGDGNTDPDWVFGNGLTASVRAERKGNGTGRIYTVTVVCADAQGTDSAPMTTTVAVPHSQGRK